MSEYTNSTPTQTNGPDDASAKDKAMQSAQAGKDAATDVAQTAVGKAQDVVGEGAAQAKNLVGEARDQLKSHAGDQQANAIASLRSLGDELHSMAKSSQQSDQPAGPATDLVRQAADRAHGAASWLDGKSTDDLVAEVRSFARRRPAAFVVGAVVAGVLAGRLTRGVVAVHQDDTESASATGSSGPAVLPAADDLGRHAYGDEYAAGYGAPVPQESYAGQYGAQVPQDPYAGQYGQPGGQQGGFVAPDPYAGQVGQNSYRDEFGNQAPAGGQSDWDPSTYVDPRGGQ